LFVITLSNARSTLQSLAPKEGVQAGVHFLANAVAYLAADEMDTKEGEKRIEEIFSGVAA
jgi:hypothetical protein